MLLKVKGLAVKIDHRTHEVTDDPEPDDIWPDWDRRPKHLITLGEAMWPEHVKADIAQQFKRIGIEDPYRQKLVEPFAYVFGGRRNDGAYDLADVNWGMVIDYFRWEAGAWDRDSDEKTAALDMMIAEIKLKYGGMFNHEMVYRI